MNKSKITKVISLSFFSIFFMLSCTLFLIHYNLFILAYMQDDEQKNLVFDNDYLDILQTKIIKVDDIEIGYKIFGKGDPLVMINGYGSIMDMWNAKLLQNLAQNHTIFIFDNRGIGNTTNGFKKFTIKQFAEDTFGLINALKLNKTDIVGFSMGGLIAQELTLSHPDKIRKLVIYASYCGPNLSLISSPEVQKIIGILGNSSVLSIEKINALMPLFFPQDWMMQNPDFVNKFIQYLNDRRNLISDNVLNLQYQAIFMWNGVCNQIHKIKSPTLAIVGTNDVLTVPANLFMIKEKIPNALLIQIMGGGHGMMHQYPDKMSYIIDQFLEN